jgi:hypothetical protein
VRGAFYEHFFLLQSNHCNRCARSASTRHAPEPGHARRGILLAESKGISRKAKETNDADLKIAFEAVAREFELRAKENVKKIAAKDSKPRGA